VEIIACGADGEVKGYLPTDVSTPAAAGPLSFACDFILFFFLLTDCLRLQVSEGATPESLQSQDEVARDLEEKKMTLLAELRNYEDGIKTSKGKWKTAQDPHMIPTDTRVEVKLEPNEAAHCVDLVISTSTYTVIQLVAVFNDQIFEGSESLVTAPDEPEATVRVQLSPT